MSRNFKYGFGIFLLFLLTVSCNRNNADAITEEQGTVAAEDVVAALDTLSKRNFDSFYAKIGTSYRDSSRSVSFKTSAWMVSDSASMFMITYASFPIIAAQVTSDSVHVSNKKDKCYSKASLEFLRQQFGIEVSLKNLEDILLGIPTNFDVGRVYYQVDDYNGRMLCTHGLKDIEKLKAEKSSEIVTYYGLNENLSELKSMTVVSFADDTEVFVSYNSRELVDGFNVPNSVSMRIISSKQEIKVDLDYSKMRVNQGESIHFVIPDSYEECK